MFAQLSVDRLSAVKSGFFDERFPGIIAIACLSAATASRRTAGIGRSTATAAGHSSKLWGRTRRCIMGRHQFCQVRACAGFTLQCIIIGKDDELIDCTAFFTFVFIDRHLYSPYV
jgi:hypothetical protein